MPIETSSGRGAGFLQAVDPRGIPEFVERFLHVFNTAFAIRLDIERGINLLCTVNAIARERFYF